MAACYCGRIHGMMLIVGFLKACVVCLGGFDLEVWVEAQILNF